MTKSILMILMASVFLSGAAQGAEVVERILAVVNDEIVTEQDLQMVMAPIVAQYKTAYTGAEFEERVKEARTEFLNKVIDDKLILGEAKKRQVVVSDAEVDEVMADIRNKFPSREAFLATLEEQGITEKKMWTRFRDQLMTQKLVGFEVKSKVSVSPGELNEYYKNHQDEFKQGDRAKLLHILIRTSSRTDDEAKAMAEDLVRKLDAGESFEELAKKYSEGAEASEGGAMGWMERGQLMGEIDDKVFMLSPGQRTEPVASSLGYHIFQMAERQEQSIKPFSEVRNQVHDTLFKAKLKERLEAWLTSLKKNAYISIR